MLASHGVLVTGATIDEATFQAACVDRMCRLAYDAMLLGKPTTPIAPGIRKAMKASLLERGADVYWAGAVRMLAEGSAGGARVAMATLDELLAEPASPPPTATARSRSCPNPSAGRGQYTVISVDDHIVEPPHTFEGRVPAKLADRAPRVIDEGRRQRGVGLRRRGDSQRRASTPSSAGRSSEYSFEPTRFDEMRRGAWDIDERIRDMDLNGVYASLCFPSFLPGFAGQRIQVDRGPRARAGDGAGVERLAARGVGRRRTRAASSRASCRTSSIPRSRPQEVRRNAERGFKAVTFSEARTCSGCRRCTPATGTR